MSGSGMAPIYALVLAGGRSTRMQRDKATLAYHGRTQLEWAVSLLQPYVQRVFVSCRPDQTNDPVRSRFDQIVDTAENLGPIAGIMAAQAKYPDVAWLVVACDLPFLDDSTLSTLISARKPDRLATAYRSSHDVLPEPLCAVYEPASREPLLAHVASGKNCPRRFLIKSDVHLIDEPNPRALDNVNTPDEYGSAMVALGPELGPGVVSGSAVAPSSGVAPGSGVASGSAVSLGSGVAPGSGVVSGSDAAPGSGAVSGSGGPQAPGAAADKRIKVQYYAILREQAGRSDESVVTAAHTPRDLYNELRARYPFSLAPEMLRVAVNAEFGDWSQRLADGDSVVFIPPVAGG
jgi:molybdopterin-guanine dinucleotide biosynthesis protein A